MTRILAQVCAATLLMLVMAGGGQPASAAEDQMSLSLDGRAWSRSIERPLFSSAKSWVPGDSELVRVWARNDSGEPADLVVEVVDQSSRPRADWDLRVTSDMTGARTDSRNRHLMSVDSTASGVPTEIKLTATMPESTGNRSQQQSTKIILRVTFTGLADGAIPPGESGLAKTGAPAVLGLLIAAALCLVSGSWLLRQRKRLQKNGIGS
jgi:hypothetical protein